MAVAVDAWARCCPLVRVLAASVAIAEKAGQVVRQTYGRDLKIIMKGIRDVQTEADRLSELCIVRSLRAKFGPDLLVISEEAVDTACRTEVPTSTEHAAEVLHVQNKIDDDLKKIEYSDLVVWVDPVDGTYEFTKGLLNHVTVMIGIAYKGRPVGGVIHQPYSGGNGEPYMEKGRSVWAIHSGGIYGDLQFKRPKLDKFIIVTTRSHGTDRLRQALEALKPDEVLRVGGVGHKAMMLLEGDAHAYIFADGGTKKWDTCAAECILYEAGGTLTDTSGKNYSYSEEAEVNNAHGIIAMAPGVDEDRRRLAESILDSKS